jgi:hypothetical protein
MQLLTDELRERLPPLSAQEADVDPMVYAKFFTSDFSWTWYVTEGSPENCSLSSSDMSSERSASGAAFRLRSYWLGVAPGGFRSSGMWILSRAVSMRRTGGRSRIRWFVFAVRLPQGFLVPMTICDFVFPLWFSGA